MSQQQNIAIAQKLLEGIGSGQDPAEIAAPFAADLVFEIQGDEGVLPWIGRRSGREAIANFIRDIRTLTEPVTFDVEDILASESRAAIVGTLQTRIKATGTITATQFAIILTVAGDSVTRFQMLEDSFDVSNAARTRSYIPASTEVGSTPPAQDQVKPHPARPAAIAP
jgi:ketosteroid isomerase-like protein